MHVHEESVKNSVTNGPLLWTTMQVCMCYVELLKYCMYVKWMIDDMFEMNSADIQTTRVDKNTDKDVCVRSPP